MRIKKRSGRRQIVVQEQVPDASRTYAESLVLSVARAHHWKELIDSGKFASLSELATAIGMAVSYVARIYRLTYLAPDIIEAVLDGNEPEGLSMRKLNTPTPLDWDQQREWLGFAPDSV